MCHSEEVLVAANEDHVNSIFLSDLASSYNASLTIDDRKISTHAAPIVEERSLRLLNHKFGHVTCLAAATREEASCNEFVNL